MLPLTRNGPDLTAPPAFYNSFPHSNTQARLASLLLLVPRELRNPAHRVQGLPVSRHTALQLKRRPVLSSPVPGTQRRATGGSCSQGPMIQRERCVPTNTGSHCAREASPGTVGRINQGFLGRGHLRGGSQVTRDLCKEKGIGGGLLGLREQYPRGHEMAQGVCWEVGKGRSRIQGPEGREHFTGEVRIQGPILQPDPVGVG